jgi:leucyl aminopeptidase (aminopeptidase T)
LLILVDAPRMGIGRRLMEAGLEAKVETILIAMPEMVRDGQEPPLAIARAMYDMQAIVIATERSMSHTLARKRASKSGARIVTMPGVTEEMLDIGGMTANFMDIHRDARQLFKRIKGTRTVRITTKAGTNIGMSVKGRPWIAEDTGICHRKGEFTNLPAGEIFISPVEGTVEGSIVVDGSFRGLVEEPVAIKVADGFATQIKGAREAVHEMNKGGKDGRMVAKVGIGLNPKARVVGKEIEDSKVMGAVSIGFGDNARFGGHVRCPSYVEAIVKDATIAIDNLVVFKEGKYAL